MVKRNVSKMPSNFGMLTSLQDDANIHLVARIVFGEARGETEGGQLAVAYTVVNRMNLPGYPNTIYKVVYQRCGNKHQYKTLDVKAHDVAWKDAIARSTDEYQNVVRAATDALFGRRPDPTNGATDFSACDPDPATSDDDLYEATGKIKVGNYYFVYKRPKPC